MHVQILFNPASGNFRARRLRALRDAFARHGALVSLGETRPDGFCPIAHEADLLCVFGGDGTARDVVNAMHAGDINLPICVYPSGTVNLIARELGYARDPDAFAARMLERNGGLQGYIVRSASHGVCLACASAGPDSHVVARVSTALKRRIGRGAYIWALLQVLVDWPRDRIRLAVDGRSIACEAFFLLKGRYYAGPWSFTPIAALGRDSFHVVIMHRARRRDFLRLVLKLLAGRPVDDLATITIIEGRNVEVSASTPLPLQIDGDLAGHAPVHFEIADRCLTYFR